MLMTDGVQTPAIGAQNPRTVMARLVAAGKNVLS